MILDHRRGRLGACALFVLASACASTSDGDMLSSSSAVTESDELAELAKVVGNDRIGRAVRSAPAAIPYRVDGVEALLGIGRRCARSDSKEIWVAEEMSSRLTGEQVLTSMLSPRLVVGGCASDDTALRRTFELFLAVVSDPARDPSDPLSTTSVEAMALDETTGLYNFYVLEPPATEGAPGTVTRFVRTANDAVEKWQKISGRPATKGPNADRKCFNCHVHGDPIMNELTDPWTNWVSSRKTFSRPLTSTSRELVSESRPFEGEHGRSSLANLLQPVVEASIGMWVEGLPEQPGSGLGQQILDGHQPGGVRGLLRSVFCETTVNYASVFDTVPIALFADLSVTRFASIKAPVAPVGSPWTLLPVRAEVDLRIERFLQKADVLRPDTVLAIRLLDDANDVFSAKRCAVHGSLAADLVPASVDAAVRDAVLAAANADRTLPSSSRALVRALVGPSVTSDERDAAEAAYISDLGARIASDVEKLEMSSGRQELEHRWRERQAKARALFPTAANPLPITLRP